MVKKTLKDQIKITVAAFIFFSCLYFVIAIWLKTDGVGFDPKSVYELLKDTLTLAAAFLAPVAAFVLFSDWREQHREINNESEALNIYRLTNKLAIELRQLDFNICFPVNINFAEIKNSQKLIDLDYLDLVLMRNKIVISEENEKFINILNQIINKDFIGLIGGIGSSVEELEILNFPEKYTQLFLDNETKEQFIDRQKHVQTHLSNSNRDDLFQKLNSNINQLYQEMSDLKI